MNQSLNKFGWTPKHLRKPERPPVAVLFEPFSDLKFPHEKQHAYKLKILLQDNLTIEAHSSKVITLQCGVRFSIGVILISLPQELKMKKLTLSNETVAEDTPDILVVLNNSSADSINLKEGDILCYLSYVNV